MTPSHALLVIDVQIAFPSGGASAAPDGDAVVHTLHPRCQPHSPLKPIAVVVLTNRLRFATFLFRDLPWERGGLGNRSRRRVDFLPHCGDPAADRPNGKRI